MRLQKLFVFLLVALAIYLAYSGLFNLFRSEEERVRLVFDRLKTALKEGNLRGALSYLSDDAYVLYRGSVFDRKEISDALRFRFFRGEVLRISGQIKRIELNRKEDALSAKALWAGEAFISRRGSGRQGRSLFRGEGEVELIKNSGNWQIRSFKALKRRKR